MCPRITQFRRQQSSAMLTIENNNKERAQMLLETAGRWFYAECGVWRAVYNFLRHKGQVLCTWGTEPPALLLSHRGVWTGPGVSVQALLISIS